MLPEVAVDPSVIWIVDSTDTVEEARNAIATALKWMKPNAAGPLGLFLSRRSVEALASLNAFPAEARLAAVLRTLDLDGVVSSKSLAASVGRFLSSNMWIEESVGLQDVLYHGTTVTPDPTLAIVDCNLRDVSIDAMGLAALCTQAGGRHTICGFPRQEEAHHRVQVSTNIDIIEVEGRDQQDGIAVDIILDVLKFPHEWARGLSSETVWRDADCATDLELAIWLGAVTSSQQSGCGLKNFRVGTEFLDSLRASGAAGDGAFAEATLAKCVQSVLLKSSLKPKPFRTSTAANASVRKRNRDNAKAWRQHVTKSHQALRLMYWELPCGQIEFATVEMKAEESIDEGGVLLPRAW